MNPTEPPCGPSEAPGGPETESVQTPPLHAETSGTGDPGRLPEVLRLRLEIKGQWRFVRVEWDGSLAQIYGNEILLLETSAGSQLEALTSALDVLLWQFDGTG